MPEHSPGSGLRLLASFPSLLLRGEEPRVANDPRPRGPAEAPAATSGPCALAEASPGDSGAPAPKAEWRGLAGHRDWPRPASLAQRAGPLGRRGSGGCRSAPTMFGRANVTRRPERVGGHGAGTRISPRPGDPPRVRLPPTPARGGAARSPEAPRPHTSPVP